MNDRPRGRRSAPRPATSPASPVMALRAQSRQWRALGDLAALRARASQAIEAALAVAPLDRARLQRRRQAADNHIQQRLHPLVAQGAAANDRDEILLEAGLAQRLPQLFRRRLPVLQERLQHRLVDLGQAFDQLAPGKPGRYTFCSLFPTTCRIPAGDA